MNKSSESYRSIHLGIANWLTMLVLVAQLIMFFVFRIIDEDISFSDYFVYNILIPGVVFFAAYIMALKIHNTKKYKDITKNLAFLAFSEILSLGIVIIDRDFPAIISVLVIPIFLATGLGEAIYLNITTIVACVSLFLLMFITSLTSEININILVSYIEFAMVIVIVRVIASAIKDFCYNSATMIESHKTNQESLEGQLLKDAMTGLYNHASFYGFLAQITKSGSSELGKISLAVIDIDNFKKVNDTYGHSKGDEVIHFLADILSRRFSSEHYVCRYGGEEFAVIFINTNGKVAKGYMEEALEEFRSHIFPWKEDAVTFSCGICEYMSGRMTDKELFGIADKVLYRAKNNGKNQCLV